MAQTHKRTYTLRRARPSIVKCDACCLYAQSRKRRWEVRRRCEFSGGICPSLSRPYSGHTHTHIKRFKTPNAPRCRRTDKHFHSHLKNGHYNDMSVAPTKRMHKHMHMRTLHALRFFVCLCVCCASVCIRMAFGKYATYIYTTSAHQKHMHTNTHTSNPLLNAPSAATYSSTRGAPQWNDFEKFAY